MKLIYSCFDDRFGETQVFLISAVNFYGFLVTTPVQLTKVFLNPDEWVLSDRFGFLPVNIFDEIHKAMCKAFGES